jgi:hypothetical protein
LQPLIPGHAAMIWLGVLGYFAVWAVVLIAVFAGYAKLLRSAARLPGSAKLIVSFVIYVVVACILVMPLLGLAFNETWRAAVNSNSVFAVVFLLGYSISVCPGILYFKRRHLDALKGLGYFQPRSRR